MGILIFRTFIFRAIFVRRSEFHTQGDRHWGARLLASVKVVFKESYVTGLNDSVGLGLVHGVSAVRQSVVRIANEETVISSVSILWIKRLAKELLQGIPKCEHWKHPVLYRIDVHMA